MLIKEFIHFKTIKLEYNKNKVIQNINSFFGYKVIHDIKIVSFEDKNIQIIRTNVQIIEDKKTIGELDCLISDKGKQIHLELVYFINCSSSIS